MLCDMSYIKILSGDQLHQFRGRALCFRHPFFLHHQGIRNHSLIMETERVSEIWDSCSSLTWLVAWKDFIAFSHPKVSSHRLYITLCRTNAKVCVLWFLFSLSRLIFYIILEWIKLLSSVISNLLFLIIPTLKLFSYSSRQQFESVKSILQKK